MRTNWRNVFWVILIWQCMSIEYSESYQFCGEELARVLSSVCETRGYFTALTPEPSSGAKETQRRKRGIVDECCRAGCPWSTLEQYCNPVETTTNYPESLPMRKRSDLTKMWIKDDHPSSDSPSYFNFNRQLGFGKFESKKKDDRNQDGESRKDTEKRPDAHSNRIFTTIVSLGGNDGKIFDNAFKTRRQVLNRIPNSPVGETNQAIGAISGRGQSERASLLKFIGQGEPIVRVVGNQDNLRQLQVGTVYPYFMSRKLFPVADSMRTTSPQLLHS